MKKETWKQILQIVITILTALGNTTDEGSVPGDGKNNDGGGGSSTTGGGSTPSGGESGTETKPGESVGLE